MMRMEGNKTKRRGEEGQMKIMKERVSAVNRR